MMYTLCCYTVGKERYLYICGMSDECEFFKNLIKYSFSMLQTKTKVAKWGTALLGIIAALAFPFIVSGVYSRVPTEVTVPIDVHVTFLTRGFNFPDLVTAAQLQLDLEAGRCFPANWKVRLINDLQFDFDEGQWPKGILNSTNSYYDVDSGFDLDSTYRNKFVLYLYNSLESNTLVVLPVGLAGVLYYNLEAVYQNDLPFFIVQAVIEHLLKSERDMLNHEPHEINSDLVFVSPNKTVTFPSNWKDFGLRTFHFNNSQDVDIPINNNSTFAYYLVDDKSNTTVPEPYQKLTKGMEDTMANDIAMKLGLTDYPSGNLELRLLSMSRKLCLEGIKSNASVRRALERCLEDQDNSVSCWVDCKNSLGK